MSENTWIQTYSGGKFNVLEPRPEDVSIIDIAHALSNLCRYGGHVRRYYSVAQHSVIVSLIAEASGLGLEGLGHDFAEAYLVDLPRPIKNAMPIYKEIEEKVHATIVTRFGLEHNEMSEEDVKEADMLAFCMEAPLLMGPLHPDFLLPQGLDMLSIPKAARDLLHVQMSPEEGEAALLKRFDELWSKRH